MHTINLEQLASVVQLNEDGSAHPDMLLGTDSHTPMINGLGVMGWGVGGLEAESVMFGHVVSLKLPEVVGVRLHGTLAPGVLSTDLALEVTHQLRQLGVAGSFVEFYGPGVATLSADERAVVANMAPEYGASTGFFPVDTRTIEYLRRTGRPEKLLEAIEPILVVMGLWFDARTEPKFERTISIDLAALRPFIAGPRRPQDRRSASDSMSAVEQALDRKLESLPTIASEVPDGAIGIAAITSCTNTSDPRLLIAAGLLARNARARDLTPPSWVKTSLAPGSPSALAYLERSGLREDLGTLGFELVGFGCTTCIGNSGPLPEEVDDAITAGKAVCAVLSGNRNFPGRVHPKLDLAYLASPPLVVAFALMGTIRGDILSDPLGYDASGHPVHLADIWPDADQIEATFDAAFRARDVSEAFESASDSEPWARIESPSSSQFPWDSESRYLRRPKFARADQPCRVGVYNARPLIVLGDDMTTDHISPAGWIDPQSEAGRWLVSRGASESDLNVYAAYRGNWEVMQRGLFTNRLARNYLGNDLEPAQTILEDREIRPIHEIASILEQKGEPTVLLAGERYGMGSSRDWAAKGVALLNVSAVIARSFERIHRSNLIGMGVVPIRIEDDFIPAAAGISPADRFQISLSVDALVPRQAVMVTWQRSDGLARIFMHLWLLKQARKSKPL